MFEVSPKCLQSAVNPQARTKRSFVEKIAGVFWIGEVIDCIHIDTERRAT